MNHSLPLSRDEIAEPWRSRSSTAGAATGRRVVGAIVMLPAVLLVAYALTLLGLYVLRAG